MLKMPTVPDIAAFIDIDKRNMEALADLIKSANSEAINVLNRRFAEAMDEVKALAEKPQ